MFGDTALETVSSYDFLTEFKLYNGGCVVTFLTVNGSCYCFELVGGGYFQFKGWGLTVGFEGLGFKGESGAFCLVETFDFDSYVEFDVVYY